MDKENSLYSDARLKENVERIPSSTLERVEGIIFKKFNFKDDETKRNYYGVIAQELEELGLNDVVEIDEKGYLGVDYISLLCMKCAQLTSDINILYKNCIDLQKEIDELKKK